VVQVVEPLPSNVSKALYMRTMWHLSQECKVRLASEHWMKHLINRKRNDKSHITIKQVDKISKGWESSSVVDCLFSMHKSLSSKIMQK
jgi:hypothetical protein